MGTFCDLVGLIFENRSPGGSDVGEGIAVEEFHKFLAVVREEGSVERHVLRPLHRQVGEDLLFGLLDLLYELGAQLLVVHVRQQLNQLLRLARPHQNLAVAVREKLFEKFSDLIFIAVLFAVLLLGKTVLQILGARYLFAVLVFQLQGEVAEHPEETGEG